MTAQGGAGRQRRNMDLHERDYGDMNPGDRLYEDLIGGAER